MAIVIIEGRRGVGKTTMCQALHAQLTAMGLDARLWKSDRTDNPTADMVKTIEQMALEPDIVFILDRFHLTEFVLSAQLGRRPFGQLVSETDFIKIMLLHNKALLFMLTASDDDVTTRLSKREAERAASEFVSQSDERGVWNLAYDAFCHWGYWTFKLSNTAQHRLDHNIRFIILQLKESFPKLFKEGQHEA